MKEKMQMKDINLNEILLSYAVNEVRKRITGKSPEEVLAFAVRLVDEALRKEIALRREVAMLVRNTGDKEQFRRLINVLEWLNVDSTEEKEDLDRWADGQL